MRALLLLAAAARLSAQDSTTSLVDRAARQYRDAKSVRATFEQLLTSPGSGNKIPSRGEYFQAAPRFALRFTEPKGDAIVSDGTSLWLYLPSSAKGQVIKMPAQAAQGLDVLTELLSAPKTNYAVSKLRDETVDSRATTVFALAPRRGDLPFTKATIWIGKSDAVIWQVETVEPSGLVRRVRFTSVRTDTDLPEDALAFTPPPGVKVIDEGALFGGKKPW